MKISNKQIIWAKKFWCVFQSSTNYFQNRSLLYILPLIVSSLIRKNNNEIAKKLNNFSNIQWKKKSWNFIPIYEIWIISFKANNWQSSYGYEHWIYGLFVHENVKLENKVRRLVSISFDFYRAFFSRWHVKNIKDHMLNN